jgi:hypothetical protein
MVRRRCQCGRSPSVRHGSLPLRHAAARPPPRANISEVAAIKLFWRLRRYYRRSLNPALLCHQSASTVFLPSRRKPVLLCDLAATQFPSRISSERLSTLSWVGATCEQFPSLRKKWLAPPTINKAQAKNVILLAKFRPGPDQTISINLSVQPTLTMFLRECTQPRVSRLHPLLSSPSVAKRLVQGTPKPSGPIRCPTHASLARELSSLTALLTSREEQ